MSGHESSARDIPVVILAGGLGSRLAEETDLRPKPMVDIGGRPILWHIMKGYAAYNLNHFVIALGFKGDTVKEFFLNYQHVMSDIRVRTASANVERLSDRIDDWVVDLIDTGLKTNTGGRIKAVLERLPDGPVCVTYGDGVSDVNIERLIEFHVRHGRSMTVTAIRPPARFGALVINDGRVSDFVEKPVAGEGWANGGFIVMDRSVADSISGPDANFERDVIEPLAADGEVMAFQHEGFWQSMDTIRDVRVLRGLWERGDPPWKVWRDK